MRVKVECIPPLPSIKAWFIIPPVSTIYDLKVTLCNELPALQSQTSADEVTLSLDGFELLDATPVDVVRDGDLITIKLNAATTRKRKTADEDDDPPRKRLRQAPTEPPPTARKPPVSNLARPLVQQPNITETSSDSSSDSDAESSTSESESDSSSDSSSTSSSSSSAPSVRPSVASAKPAIGLKQVAKAKATTSSIKVQNTKDPISVNVPPGQGKSSTRNRNLRRRKKKQYETSASLAEPANSNDIPLGQKIVALRDVPTTTEAYSSTPIISAPTPKPTPPTFMMASLSNKNKRRGFKQAMTSATLKKIVFAEDGDTHTGAPQPAAADELPFAGKTSADISNAAPNLFPRLVPPSELQEQGILPPNMFVTSIDVEEGMHPPRRKNKKQRVEPYVSEVQEVEPIVLDYGYADDVIPSQREDIAAIVEDTEAMEHDWSAVEARWDSLLKLTAISQVQRGTVLGWKALAINPATFTPEFLLNIGRVTNTDEQDMLTIQPIHRPGAMEVSFGGFADEEDEVVPLEEETFQWADVLGGEWRIVS